MTVLVVKYFTYLKFTALDRLRVRLNVILFKLHLANNAVNVSLFTYNIYEMLKCFSQHFARYCHCAHIFEVM